MSKRQSAIDKADDQWQKGVSKKLKAVAARDKKERLRKARGWKKGQRKRAAAERRTADFCRDLKYNGETAMRKQRKTTHRLRALRKDEEEMWATDKEMALEMAERVRYSRRRRVRLGFAEPLLKLKQDYECGRRDAEAMLAVMCVTKAQFWWLMHAFFEFLPLDTAIDALRLLRALCGPSTGFDKRNTWFWRLLFRRDFGAMHKPRRNGTATNWHRLYVRKAVFCDELRTNAMLRMRDGSFELQSPYGGHYYDSEEPLLAMSDGKFPGGGNTSVFAVSEFGERMRLIPLNKTHSAVYNCGTVVFWRTHSRKCNLVSGQRVESKGGCVEYRCVVKYKPGFGSESKKVSLFSDWFYEDPMAPYCRGPGVHDLSEISPPLCAKVIQFYGDTDIIWNLGQKDCDFSNL